MKNYHYEDFYRQEKPRRRRRCQMCGKWYVPGHGDEGLCPKCDDEELEYVALLEEEEEEV